MVEIQPNHHVEIINKTRYKNIPIEVLYYLINKYGIKIYKLIIDKHDFNRGCADIESSDNTIYIYPSKYETYESYKWVIAHEYAHILCYTNNGLYKLLQNKPSDLNNMTEEMFCTMFACMESGGLYDLNWYLKRKDKQNKKI
jgi:Zn-dependent peptidase ImmA (M78 family)